MESLDLIPRPLASLGMAGEFHANEARSSSLCGSLIWMCLTVRQNVRQLATQGSEDGRKTVVSTKANSLIIRVRTDLGAGGRRFKSYRPDQSLQ